ncbi:putative bifunctional diguanylate cyclase/phosphodiesterase [Nitrosomonas supralitoralis]|uniref:GGDEF domain-containing protein n=1 Tax=Nitrosomonas supralitoralis TaxID=2116706 RepID=A0A2P7NYU3_9PROT|nr:GGDEF domain-containing phosphodiesterase [Nitrosomonas supralitoralis]PSJ18624.1 GGDEF domain-containing protein [Nitrosomonas supralitoralis]
MNPFAYQHFLQQAAQTLHDENQLGRRNAVLIINFERLTELDGVLGFTVVDNILQQIAQQLGDALNPGDLVGITGRYQIACLLVDLLTDAHAMLAAHKILRIMAPPFVLDRKNIILAPRLGVALNSESDHTLDQLMCNASTAVRQAKLEQNPIKLFYAEMQDPLLFQIDLWSDLDNAIENGGLYLGYQPQIDIASGRIKSTEALLRWHHPLHGMIPTDKLIRVAEGTALMPKLTLWVFHTALRECSEYRRAGLNAGVSINFSADDLRDPELTEIVSQGLALWNVPPGDITIELTETAVMDNHAGTLNTLCQLKDMGLKLAMDDFGTGYSSMARMLDLPLDEVKIDMIFVKHMTKHHKHERIVDSMISLAHRLNLSVVAEGVEDVATYERLRVLGCDIIQGYLIGKAMPLPELINTVSDQFPTHRLQTTSQLTA